MVDKDRFCNDFLANSNKSDKEMPELHNFLFDFKKSDKNQLNVNKYNVQVDELYLELNKSDLIHSQSKEYFKKNDIQEISVNDKDKKSNVEKKSFTQRDTKVYFDKKNDFKYFN